MAKKIMKGLSGTHIGDVDGLAVSWEKGGETDKAEEEEERPLYGIHEDAVNVGCMDN